MTFAWTYLQTVIITNRALLSFVVGPAATATRQGPSNNTKKFYEINYVYIYEILFETPLLLAT